MAPQMQLDIGIPQRGAREVASAGPGLPSPGSMEANTPEKGAQESAVRDDGALALPAWATGSKKEPGQWLSLLDRTIISNTLICTGAAIAEPLMGMADTAFVGHLGLVPLASLGPNNTAFSFISFFAAFSLSVATTDRIATSRAQGQPQEGAMAVSIALTISIYLGSLLAAVMIAFPHQILAIVGANDEIMPMAVTFMQIRACSVPPMLVCIALEGAYRAFLDLRTPFIVIAGAAALNVALNALFLFGLGMGVGGSALATTLSTFVSASCFLGYMHWRDRHQFRPVNDHDKDVKQYHDFLSNGLMFWRVWRSPAWRREAATIAVRCGTLIVRATLIVAVYSVAGAVAARMGTAEVAGHQVLRQLLSLQVCLTWAYMSVGQSLVANLFEAGPSGRAVAAKVAMRVIIFGCTTATALSFAMWLFRQQLPALIVKDASVLAVMGPAMLPACVMLLTSANNAFEGVLLGSGDAAFCSKSFLPASLTAVAMLFVALKAHGGLQAIWWALASYYSVLLLLFSARVLLPAMKGPLLMHGGPQAPPASHSAPVTDKVR